jgi:hypothetical protein
VVNDVEIGFVVNLRILKQVLQGVNVEGRRWWLACDPEDAIHQRFVEIGYGYPGCNDRLNTIVFRFPVLNGYLPRYGRPDLIVGIERALVDLNYSRPPAREGMDGVSCLEEFSEFFLPLRDALVARLMSDR